MYVRTTYVYNRQESTNGWSRDGTALYYYIRREIPFAAGRAGIPVMPKGAKAVGGGERGGGQRKEKKIITRVVRRHRVESIIEIA